ncbi:MAG: hypothetical protein UY44_C0008G0035 [Candidatus Kaiserbacteria bacterium GW2011_GWA2_49_19]|uniref:Methyltransferase domain-containing protein n=2 Tax=Candidatus Kaiseribacteriota TaxID=1752734 RepID=A0A0G1VQX6_9BACT|nr:MAG: hypothetical protein UY44_C0008G0035 [Candidatus Kaiserbacteria bacterium GW2011_GWA2_49_19]OGG60945.1 MAG: hypothetical protein A3C86_04125 [Candidatus Kaiserbacteria bacterium RIFCSPHIGHO2_02_FULL_49_16]
MILYSVAILGILLMATFSLYFLFLLDALFGGEDFATSENAIRKIGEIIVASNKQDGILYDLGSSRGNFVYSILKICPALRVIGIDNSRLRVWFARMVGIFHFSNQIFKKADIFDIDVSKADVIYVYVPRDLLPALEKKLEEEIKHGALVITYRINFPTWSPHQMYSVDPRNPKDEKVYFYRPV